MNDMKNNEPTKSVNRDGGNMLELPKTLRVPDLSEMPINSSNREMLEKRKTANIVEGYTLQDKNEKLKKTPFNFYAEININNSRLWDLIVLLSIELPDQAGLVFGPEKCSLQQYLQWKSTFQKHCPTHQ